WWKRSRLTPLSDGWQRLPEESLTLPPLLNKVFERGQGLARTACAPRRRGLRARRERRTLFERKSPMTQVSDPTPPQTFSDTDLAAEVQRVLEGSAEPLTLSKIRSSLPARLRGVSLEALAEVLRRQVAANVLVPYPKYRSQQDRFWDRPMNVHIAHLLRQALE